MEPLILCWWGNELRLIFSSGEVHLHSLAENTHPSASIISHLMSEKHKTKVVRIIYYSDKLTLNSIKNLKIPVSKIHVSKSKRSRLESKLSSQYPILAQSSCIWSLTYDLRLSNNFSSLAIINDPELILLSRELKKLGYTIEGIWPLPFLMHTLPNKQNQETGSFCIACTDKQLLITTTSASGDWKCDNIPIHANDSVTLSGLKNARLRFEEESTPSGWLATDTSSEHNPYIYNCRELGLNEIMLSHVLYNTRHLSAYSWGNMYFEGIASHSFLSLRTLSLVLLLGLAAYGIYVWRSSILQKNLRLEINKKEAIATELLSKETHAKELKSREEITLRDYTLLQSEPQTIDTILNSIAEACSHNYTIQSLHILNDTIQITLELNDPTLSRGKLTDLCATLNSNQAQWSFSAQANQESISKIRGYRIQTQTQAPAISEAKVQELLLHLHALATFNKSFSLLQSRWSITSHKLDSYGTFLVHHIDLNLIDTHIDSWSTILSDIHELSLTPHLTCNELHLSLDPDNPGFFKEAWIRLTARTTL
jgi:hypothetical protein